MCPANEDVREYFAVLCDDIVDQFDISLIRLEGIITRTYDFDWLRPRVVVSVPPVARELLAVCFCASCTAQAAAEGLDVPHLRGLVNEAISAELGRGADSVDSKRAADASADPELRAFLVQQVRSSTDFARTAVSRIDAERAVRRTSTTASTPFPRSWARSKRSCSKSWWTSSIRSPSMAETLNTTGTSPPLPRGQHRGNLDMLTTRLRPAPVFRGGCRPRRRGARALQLRIATSSATFAISSPPFAPPSPDAVTRACAWSVADISSPTSRQTSVRSANASSSSGPNSPRNPDCTHRFTALLNATKTRLATRRQRGSGATSPCRRASASRDDVLPLQSEIEAQAASSGEVAAARVWRSMRAGRGWGPTRRVPRGGRDEVVFRGGPARIASASGSSRYPSLVKITSPLVAKYRKKVAFDTSARSAISSTVVAS